MSSIILDIQPDPEKVHTVRTLEGYLFSQNVGGQYGDWYGLVVVSFPQQTVRSSGKGLDDGLDKGE